jgi:hypothetical protein
LGLEGVTSGLANLVTFYQLGASGDTLPIGVFEDPPLPDTVPPAKQNAVITLPLNLDTGIWPEPNLSVPPTAADSNVWVTNLSPLVCSNTDFQDCNCFDTPLADCTTSHPAADVCGSGSLVQWAVGAPSPTIMIGGCPAGVTDPAEFSDVVAPIGIFVDDVPVTVCEPADDSDLSQGNCEDGQVENTSEDFDAPRIWAVESGLGAVTLHVPALAEELGLSIPTNVQFPLSTAVPPPATIFFSQPPLGGFFAVTTDGLLPPPDGDSTDVPTTPKYIAIDASQTTAYVTDTSLGKRRTGTKGEFGRIKEFSLSSTPTQFCVDPPLAPADDCNTFWQIPVVDGTFTTTIEGRGTMLNAPQGIATFTLPGVTGDFVIVANTGSNTVTEYAPGATGNTKPDAVLSSPGGKIHTLDLPVGITTTPVF